MIDRDRLLAKLDELDGYLRELRSITPQNLEDYRRIATKRACERLIHVNKHLDDFEAFKRIVLAYLRSAAPPR